MMKIKDFTKKELKDLFENYCFENKDFDDMIKIYEDENNKVFGFDESIFIIDKKEEMIVDCYEDSRLYFIEYGIDEIKEKFGEDEICFELEEIREELKERFDDEVWKNDIIMNNLEKEEGIVLKKYKEFDYEELKKVCFDYNLKTTMNVVSYLIGYNDYIDVDDWNIIMELRYNEVIE